VIVGVRSVLLVNNPTVMVVQAVNCVSREPSPRLVRSANSVLTVPLLRDPVRPRAVGAHVDMLPFPEPQTVEFVQRVPSLPMANARHVLPMSTRKKAPARVHCVALGFKCKATRASCVLKAPTRRTLVLAVAAH